MENNLNETLSRIRSVIKQTLGQRIAENYFIKGNRGEPYRIELEPSLVEFNV